VHKKGAKTKSVLEARSTLQKNKVFCDGEVFFLDRAF